MGAGDWVGYATSTSNPSSAYAAYSNPLQSTYGYDTSEHHPHSHSHHHSNMHLSSVLPDVAQNYCPPEYYHHSNNSSLGALTGNSQSAQSSSAAYPSSALSGSAPKLEIDTSYSPSGYYNYNNYNQYASCPTVPPSASGPPAAPTMVLYPQLYSTVNQNQIHLHLHGTDKIEHYLGADSSFTISSISAGNGGAGNNVAGGPRSAGIEIDIGSTDNTIGIMANEAVEQQHQQHSHHHDHEIVEVHGSRASDGGDLSVGGDPGNVWRPY
jgi:RUNX transcription factor Lozenge